MSARQISVILQPVLEMRYRILKPIIPGSTTEAATLNFGTSPYLTMHESTPSPRERAPCGSLETSVRVIDVKIKRRLLLLIEQIYGAYLMID